MKDWKIGTRIAGGFTAVILIAMVFGLFAYGRIGVIDKSSSDVSENTLPSVHLMDTVAVSQQRIAALMLEHAISRDQREMVGIEAQINALPGEKR